MVSSDVNRQTADPKEKKASSDGEQEQKAKDTADDTDESTEWCVYICGQVANPGVYRVKPSCRKGLSRGFKSRPYSHYGRQQCAQICASSCYRKE